MVEIVIQSLDEGIHEVLLEPTPQDLNLDPDEFTAIEVHARLDFNPRRILVNLAVSGIATLECDRTLVRYTHPVRSSYVVLFADASIASAEDDLDDVRPLAPGAQTIDVTDAVRDTLLLALPLRRVAPEAEELDLPVRFGEDDQGVDPRWEALRSLRKDDAQE